jgi:ATP-dependent exoDNAse (exonuclease V) alpha subunit
MIAAGLPYGELIHVRRNAGQIVHACVRIKCGEEFETADRVDLDATPPQNLRLIETRNEDDTAEVLDALLSRMSAFHPVWGCQVIIARNKGGKLTRKPLNDRLQLLLNPDGRQVAGNPFRVGDKVICLKNCKQTAVQFVGEEDDAAKAGPKNYVNLYAVDRWTGHREPTQQRVANGEIGRVLAIDATEVIAVFSEREDPVRIYLSKKKGDEKHADDAAGDDEGRGGNFDLAYAVTCHKMQGSQAPCVIVVGDPQGGGVCSAEWLYTAVSRPEKLGVLIGAKSLFMKMVGRKSTTRRKTFLTDLIREGQGNATTSNS